MITQYSQFLLMEKKVENRKPCHNYKGNTANILYLGRALNIVLDNEGR